MMREIAQLPLSLAMREEATLDNFVAGNNGELVGELKRLVTSGSGGFLYMHGKSGCGKSHLLQAACHLAGVQQLCCYLPMRELRDFGPSLFDDIEGLDLLCVDDFEAMPMDNAWQDGFFHLFNRLQPAGKLIVAAQNRVSDLGLTLPDLASRLASGASYRLADMDDRARMEMLDRRAKNRGLQMTPETLKYLLARADRNTNSLLETLDTLDASALAAGRRLTVPVIKAVMNW